MDNPLIDQRHFQKEPWKRELMWVQRNALGIIVGIEEKMPESENISLDLPNSDVKGQKEEGGIK